MKNQSGLAGVILNHVMLKIHTATYLPYMLHIKSVETIKTLSLTYESSSKKIIDIYGGRGVDSQMYIVNLLFLWFVIHLK